MVGHSQGGMMPNYYLKFLDGASTVHALFGLSPSNHGTTVSGLTNLIEQFPFASLLVPVFLEVIGAPSLPQQEAGSAFQKKLFGGGDTVAGPRYVVIQTTHDEVVTPYANAFLSGSSVTNITVQNQCPKDPVGHIGMFEDGLDLDQLEVASSLPELDTPRRVRPPASRLAKAISRSLPIKMKLRPSVMKNPGGGDSEKPLAGLGRRPCGVLSESMIWEVSRSG